MAISCTYHGKTRTRGRGDGSSAEALQPSIGDAVAVADGAASTALDKTGWYRLVATTASRVKFGASVTNGNNGEVWPEAHVEARYLVKGTKIGVSAL